MNFHIFAQFLYKLEKESSRNLKVDILSQLLKQLNIDEVANSLYLIEGRVAPRYETLEFGMSTKIIIRALKSNHNCGDLTKKYTQLGDVGLLVEGQLEGNKDIGLDINTVFAKLRDVAKISGNGSINLKINLLLQLFQGLDDLSNRYVARIIVGKLRLGLDQKTILDSISWAIAGDKSLRPHLERAYGVSSDIGKIAYLALSSKAMSTLDNVRATPGIPIISKLVEREKDTESIFKRMDCVLVQPKYDGLRAQIHFNSNGLNSRDSYSLVQDNMFKEKHQTTRIYSRNMGNITNMFPNIVRSLENIKSGSFILDSEIIGFNSKDNTFFSFQDTISRKRKYGVENKAAEIPVRAFVFDILFFNGRDVTYIELNKRLHLLQEIIRLLNIDDIVLTKTTKVISAPDLEDIFVKYINDGLEGIIAKDCSSYYKPGTRNYDWIKLKASSREGFVDTVDAVILGYYRGKGMRTKLGIGALLVGLIDHKQDKFVSLAKLGTGITYDEWLLIKGLLVETEVKSKPGNVLVSDALTPDIWVEPKLVVEVEADEITISNTHKAGSNSYNKKGYSLRFPRMKTIRADKDAQSATSVKELKRMIGLKRERFK